MFLVNYVLAGVLLGVVLKSSLSDVVVDCHCWFCTSRLDFFFCGMADLV